MRELGASVASEGRIFFTGGVSAVLLGWRETTLDVDLKADPEPVGFFESLPSLKEELDINIELASPDQFVPPLPDWLERCRSIARHGKLEFFHYDFYSQALAKIERAHARDRRDVAHMLESGLVQPQKLGELFSVIEPLLIRYPALDANELRSRVSAIAAHGVWP